MTADAPTKPDIALPEPNLHWATPADDATIERTAEALRAKGYEVFVADDRATARQIIIGPVPEGAEVSQGASVKLEEIGGTAVNESWDRSGAIRQQPLHLDYKTEEGRGQGRRT